MGASGSKEDIEFIELVGKGFFGEVYKANYTGKRISEDDHKEDRQKNHSVVKQIVAVKQINKNLIKEYSLEDQLRREINILSDLKKHDNIVSLHFSWEDDIFYYIVMEFIACNLFELLKQQKRFRYPVASEYFSQIVKGIQYLHSKNVMHRDIKPENILIDLGIIDAPTTSEGGSDNSGKNSAQDPASNIIDKHTAPKMSLKNYRKHTLKIADFGWSQRLEGELRSTFCGTLHYLAPEMIRSNGHTFSVDVWSLGILLYELLCGMSPFDAVNQEDVCVKILKNELKWPRWMENRIAKASQLVHPNGELKTTGFFPIVSDTYPSDVVSPLGRNGSFGVGSMRGSFAESSFSLEDRSNSFDESAVGAARLAGVENDNAGGSRNLVANSTGNPAIDAALQIQAQERKNQRIVLEAEHLEHAQDLVQKLLKVKPEERITVDATLDHPFIVKNQKELKKSDSNKSEGSSQSDDKAHDKEPHHDDHHKDHEDEAEDEETRRCLEVRRLQTKLLIAENEVTMILKSRQRLEEDYMRTCEETEEMNGKIRLLKRENEILKKENDGLRSHLSSSGLSVPSDIANTTSIGTSSRASSNCASSTNHARSAAGSAATSAASLRSSASCMNRDGKDPCFNSNRDRLSDNCSMKSSGSISSNSSAVLEQQKRLAAGSAVLSQSKFLVDGMPSASANIKPTTSNSSKGGEPASGDGVGRLSSRFTSRNTDLSQQTYLSGSKAETSGSGGKTHCRKERAGSCNTDLGAYLKDKIPINMQNHNPLASAGNLSSLSGRASTILPGDRGSFKIAYEKEGL